MIFYQNTKHNQRNYIIVGSQSNFVIINTIIFGQFRTNYQLHGKKRTNESLIENFIFFYDDVYTFVNYEFLTTCKQAVGSKKAVVNHAFLICTPLSWGRGHLLPPRPAAPSGK